ncbi:hypothetical protein DFH09DRAFT_1480339 [Mycena vulgaris]|nr:hypothetical protein DFH09DRAFT_1480339 [Mycena vulgaris]
MDAFAPIDFSTATDAVLDASPVCARAADAELAGCDLPIDEEHGSDMRAFCPTHIPTATSFVYPPLHCLPPPPPEHALIPGALQAHGVFIVSPLPSPHTTPPPMSVTHTLLTLPLTLSAPVIFLFFRLRGYLRYACTTHTYHACIDIDLVYISESESESHLIPLSLRSSSSHHPVL